MVLTKEQLATELVGNGCYTKKEAVQLIECFFKVIQETLVNGEAVKLRGFGTFELRDKTARIGRNPVTLEPHKIAARRVVTFRPSAKLNMQVNNSVQPKMKVHPFAVHQHSKRLNPGIK